MIRPVIPHLVSSWGVTVRAAWPDATDADVTEVVEWATDDAERWSDGESMVPTPESVRRRAMEFRDSAAVVARGARI